MIGGEQPDPVGDGFRRLVLIHIQDARGDPVPEDRGQFGAGPPARLSAPNNEYFFIVCKVLFPTGHRQELRFLIESHIAL